MGFKVRFTPEAEEDLLRLFDFLLEQDLAMAEKAYAAIAKSVELLEVFPFSCRKALGGDGNPFLRELIVPFGGFGYVALFEIENGKTVSILAVRHQREEDYH
ncbi:MAG: type II toxin-antitoxin system RelE/ParE family toxin [Sterolibacteriaceae bacterium MAG5]|nr:type II toxin-antitoxin system RelE/ParE family toxin [Candidatus Nitricoxidireducens bremensis]